MDLDKALKERHSARSFFDKKPDWRDIIKAIDAANLAPLAGNIPALRFILVDDTDKINQLAEASQQDFVAEAYYVVAIVSDPNLVEKSYGERAEKYLPQQAGAAIENFLLKITELGLSSCWVGAFVDEQVKRILQIPDSAEVEAILPVGYEKVPKSKQRKKSNLDPILFFNIWKNKYMKPLKKPESV